VDGTENLLTRTHGIGRRIARLVALATFLAVLSAALMQTLYQTHLNIESRKSSLQATAYALASAAADAAVNQDRTKALAALSAVSRIPNILTASIKNPDGRVLASLGQSAYLVGDVLVERDNAAAILFKGYLPISVDIVKGGKTVGQLAILSDIRSLRTQTLFALLTTFAAAIVAASLGVAASKPLQRRITLPLVQLTQNIQSLRNSRDYSTAIVDDGSPDETGVLAKAFNGLMSDIRTRDKALQNLAYNDPLTGLPNRVSFQRDLDEWLERKFEAKPGAVALMNINSFRSMNDAFGHSSGDAILMTVAATIKSAIRDHATVNRYGGDEFAILLRDAETTADVEMTIARIQSAFFKPLEINQLELHINLTVGAVMLAPNNGLAPSSSDVLRHADLALADAKRNKANHVLFFRQELADEVEYDTNLGQALRQVIKDEGFEVYYQPQLDLKNNCISGYEALLRWQDPTRGFVSPGVFIPLAERLGLMSIIGDWVMSESCRQAAQWLRQGYTNRVMSVNVSPAQILTAGFIEKVRSALGKSGLPPDLLCLELTESMFVGSHYAETIMVLETLKKDGVKLSLDDFGTGYSSLSYLTTLPFHMIKIDRSFVSDADKSQRKADMLKSLVEMIHALGMSVVAEGAETAEEVALLQKLEIEKVQGFIIARPSPHQQALLRANEIDQRYKMKVS
jgi:diguanylate cyclase (GGDEF)-like protein